jgi:hypothetical protein
MTTNTGERFRLSNNLSWATEFSAATVEEFRERFVQALRRCRGRLVSLHAFDAGWGAQWTNVGRVLMGVFYDGREANARLPRCEQGRFEIRGNGLEFLSVGPEAPCGDAVWALICNERVGTEIPRVECRAAEILAGEDLAADLVVTHREMQVLFEEVMRRAQAIPVGDSGVVQRLRDAVEKYRFAAEAFVAQGRTRGTVTGAMACLMQRVAAAMRVTVPEMLGIMARVPMGVRPVG